MRSWFGEDPVADFVLPVGFRDCAFAADEATRGEDDCSARDAAGPGGRF